MQRCKETPSVRQHIQWHFSLEMKRKRRMERSHVPQFLHDVRCSMEGFSRVNYLLIFDREQCRVNLQPFFFS